MSGGPVAAGVLFVCTGNRCRSPMAEALLRSHLAERRADLRSSSAGFAADGLPPPPEVVQVMRDIGLDVAAHRSRRVRPATLEGFDLVVAMTRQHLAELTVMAPPAWARCYTFADLLRRAEATGGRGEGEALTAWSRRVHAGRTRSGVLALPPSDDVADPIGKKLREYQKARDLLAGMTLRLADLLAPA
ncbi:MAG: hypothetical protein ACRDYY_11790 [Acidimicrobiales bacterium]